MSIIAHHRKSHGAGSLQCRWQHDVALLAAKLCLRHRTACHVAGRVSRTSSDTSRFVAHRSRVAQAHHPLCATFPGLLHYPYVVLTLCTRSDCMVRVGEGRPDATRRASACIQCRKHRAHRLCTPPARLYIRARPRASARARRASRTASHTWPSWPRRPHRC